MEIKHIFQRSEKKYKITAAQYEQLYAIIKQYMYLDEYGRHTINNIYYDNDTFDLTLRSMDKPLYKEKFRIRCYGLATPQTPLFLELKKKHDGIVYKRRATLSQQETYHFLQDYTQSSSQILKEIAFTFQQYHLKPKMFIAYERMAYTNQESELRITFDQNIRYRLHNLNFHNDTHETTFLQDNDYLMEIKCKHSIPLWLSKALSDLQIYPTSYSKVGNCFQHILKKGELSYVK